MRHFLVSWHKRQSHEVTTEMELGNTILRILGDKRLSSQISVQMVCSNCHRTFGEATDQFNTADGIDSSRLKRLVTSKSEFTFCPYCGAKLDEE